MCIQSQHLGSSLGPLCHSLITTFIFSFLSLLFPSTLLFCSFLAGQAGLCTNAGVCQPCPAGGCYSTVKIACCWTSVCVIYLDMHMSRYCKKGLQVTQSLSHFSLSTKTSTVSPFTCGYAVSVVTPCSDPCGGGTRVCINYNQLMEMMLQDTCEYRESYYIYTYKYIMHFG